MGNKKSATNSPRPGQRAIQGKSKAQQHFKAESDINTIVRRYLPTGSLPSTGRQPMYGDFTSFDYMSMLNAVADIDNTFAMLPARIRGRFRNDPHQLLRFVENPANQKEAVRLGLLQDPSRPFGAPVPGEGVDGETGLADDQTDMMSQAEILEALDPGSKNHDPSVMSDLQASAQAGDAEAKALLEVHAAKMAAQKASRAASAGSTGPIKKRPSPAS